MNPSDSTPEPCAAAVTRRGEDGYLVVGLANAYLAIEIVPALGARLLSLRDRATGREWFWRAGDARGLFANALDDAFETSPLAGADECLPTVVRCHHEGRDLPDHGECWASSWTLDEAALAEGRIVTVLDLPRSPLRIERTLSLRERTVRLDYRLSSRTDAPQRWLYAFHPLFPVEPGDRIELPDCQPSPECLEGQYAKAFHRATPSTSSDGEVVPEGRAALIRADGARLELWWDAQVLPWCAIWITRGAWNGHRHLALEPTTAPADVPDSVNVPLAPGETVGWHINMRAV